MRTAEARLNDVRNLVDAAGRLVARRHTLETALIESTGLSAAGLELAWTRHLETDATDTQIRALVAGAGDASRVAVILSSNVFVGSLRALAIARAASDDVVVRPSRRDPAFVRELVREAADPTLLLDETLDIASVETGEVHVYGRDATIADVRARTRRGVKVRGHGSGMGIAWVGGDLTTAARALAADVVVFDQRGCLSPRVVLVRGDLSRAERFAECLHAELERLERVVRRGPVPADERAAGDRYVATMTYACRALVGAHHAIGIAPPGAPLVLPPTHRHVHVAACESTDAARAAIAPLTRAIVAVGSDDLAAARTFGPAWARRSALGEMQRPPLDGPVDQRDAFVLGAAI